MLLQLSPQDFERLARIVREETGNRVAEKNFPMIEARMRGHLMNLGLASMDEYWTYFNSRESEERQLLLSLMTTHYTFFFREYVHFEVLQKWLDQNLDRLRMRYAADKTPLRVWSAACSRGQEAYSLAMFLELNLKRPHGIPFEILASDVDPESVKYAKNGVYPIAEVNTIPNQYLSGLWRRGTGAIKDFAAVHPSLQQNIRFSTLNLFELGPAQSTGMFDVVFCRNVFIYFSQSDVQKVALDLFNRLNPGGFLVTGVSESLRFADWEFQSMGPSCYGKPLPEQNRPKPALRIVSEKAPGPTQTKYRVLCVDDSPTIQALIRKIFSQDADCASVEVAGNGREAREKLDKSKFDLITLDIHMPEVNGIEFLERLYKRGQDAPVLMVSSVNRSDLELATKSLTLGAFDYVEKPAMNNLQKSTAEILTKAKMALRARKAEPPPPPTATYDASLAQKIVVPDASLCLRLVVAGPRVIGELEQVVKAQRQESRSPALLVLWTESEGLPALEASLLSWSEHKIQRLPAAAVPLRPNSIYIAPLTGKMDMLSNSHVRSLSVQMLTLAKLDFKTLPSGLTVQFLLSEKLMANKAEIERECGHMASDITPATSFASLSVEFFVHLRKAAA